MHTAKIFFIAAGAALHKQNMAVETLFRLKSAQERPDAQPLTNSQLVAIIDRAMESLEVPSDFLVGICDNNKNE